MPVCIQNVQIYSVYLSRFLSHYLRELLEIKRQLEEALEEEEEKLVKTSLNFENWKNFGKRIIVSSTFLSYCHCIAAC